MPDDRPADLFRRALGDPDDESPGKELSRVSILASAAHSPELMDVYRDWQLRAATELDLDLGGDGVIGHRTLARRLGPFMTRTAESVKELAKDISGMKSHTAGLLVEAPAPGSVRIRFRTPPPRTKTFDQVVDWETEVESLDALALRRFASVLMQAQADEDDLGETASPLIAAVASMRPRARRALTLVGNAVIDGRWDIHGELLVKGMPMERLRFDRAAAARLVASAADREIKRTTTTLPGLVDGWRWSQSTMQFIPDLQKRSILVSVPQELRSSVARIISSPEHRALAVLNVVTMTPTGDALAGRNSYELHGIEPLEPPSQLPES